MADRLFILTKEEINSLYSIPKLDDEERAFLFELDETSDILVDINIEEPFEETEEESNFR